MKIFNDILTFIKTLTFVDFVFFIAILMLMVLFVTLIYFIIINKDYEEEKKEADETAEMRIVRELKDKMKNDEVVINFTNYEKDQEDKAIISYDELLNKKNNYEINYADEQTNDDITVKRVDLDNLVNKNNVLNETVEVRLFSFAKEEAFLEALKQLQKELN